MGSYLTIISESGFPHAACLVEHSAADQRWYGWMPGRNTYLWGAAGEGYLDTQPREQDIARFARWEIWPLTLECAEANISMNYMDGSGYALYERDCIRFVMDVCSWCGLMVLPRIVGIPGWGNYLPIEAVWKLGLLNPVQRTHFGTFADQPYPWNVCSKQ